MLATRNATPADAGLIAAHRHAMFAEMGKSDNSTLDEMRRNFMPWVERMLAAGKYVGWVVLDGERPVASAGFFELEWPPHPWDPASEHRGYLLNFWVEPAFRGQGLAHSLVRGALAEARRRKLRVVALHASDAGRHVYHAMGFRETNEMIYVEESAE
jgi:ribosomal protein S18 acetylase RimI-like enzyme